MSYNVFGNGCIIIDKELPDDVIKALSADFLIEKSFDGGLWLSKEYSKDQDVDGAMQKLAPFVFSGKIEMTGEDYACWRYRFWKGRVYYEAGKIVYMQAHRKFNVCYYDPNKEEEETQIVVKGDRFVAMFNELTKLFAQFCAEKYGSAQEMCEIECIEEIPYSGEEE